MHPLSAAMIELNEHFANHGMSLFITNKAVKNINFRIKADGLHISKPRHISQERLIAAIDSRMDWVVRTHQALIAKNQSPPRLWGEIFDAKAWLHERRTLIHARTFRRLDTLDDEQTLLDWIYRDEISRLLPELLDKWQPMVGKSATTICLKKMSSRWGSCNVRTAKIALSTNLAAYPVGCLAYVLVHELCHLHHANHSQAFWASVKKAMPDYQYWHGLLKSRHSSL
ncbi:M48 family metallopeptidase [Moraxella marmotae]|uniref:M48 family metallopeptidase n=1 Tax=Moraxella marmotae TaxID=3344520 RepID=UPI0035F447D1